MYNGSDSYLYPVKIRTRLGDAGAGRAVMYQNQLTKSELYFQRVLADCNSTWEPSQGPLVRKNNETYLRCPQRSKHDYHKNHGSRWCT